MEWLTRIIPGQAPNGAPILSVLGKRTYRFNHGQIAQVDAEEQIPFIEADEFWGEGNPQFDSMKLESDLVAYKPMTDVVVIGKAHSPKARKTGFLDIGVQVGAVSKIARVFGDRKAYITPSGIGFSEPVPFSEMALNHSQAYGGQDTRSDEGNIYVYPKNPVGKGFVVKNTPKAIQDLLLPNLENPKSLLSPQNLVLGRFEAWPQGPEPWAFGYQNKNFHPRYTFSGLTSDQRTEAESARLKRAKLAPEVGAKGTSASEGFSPILNPVFFNGASTGLAMPRLNGSETIKLANLDPNFSQFSFQLPGIKPIAWLDVGEGPEDLDMALHTVVLYKETNQLTLVWRGCSYYGGIEAMKDFKRLEYGIKES